MVKATYTRRGKPQRKARNAPMVKPTYTRRENPQRKARKKGRSFNPIPLLVTLIALALLGYFFLSVHGPIMIHLW